MWHLPKRATHKNMFFINCSDDVVMDPNLNIECYQNVTTTSIYGSFGIPNNTNEQFEYYLANQNKCLKFHRDKLFYNIWHY